MKEKLFYNLQFFAEEEGAEVQEIAEPDVEQETVDAEEETGESPEEPVEQDAETNARFAAARRKAEADFKREIERRDAEYARRFQGLTNPITGAPIMNERDYFDALDAQEQLARNEQLQNAGIDPSIIDDAIARNPMVREAQQIIKDNADKEARRMIEEEMLEISKIDPDVKTIEDIPQEQMDKIIGRVRAGLSFLDAYKMENFDKLMARNIEQSRSSATQKAINDAKSKGHLNTGVGASESDNLVEIPNSRYEHFRRAFPNDTPLELKQRYNATL